MNAMVEKQFVVKNETGLHARPASMFVQKAAKFKSIIKLQKEGKEANAKSIISVLSLGASKGSKVTISCTGADEKEALDALIELLDNLEE
jgi:phosphocarrier protein HPr